MDFEVFRGPLVAALRRSVHAKVGRPTFDPVLMFKILVLKALYSLSIETVVNGTVIFPGMGKVKFPTLRFEV